MPPKRPKTNPFGSETVTGASEERRYTAPTAQSVTDSPAATATPPRASTAAEPETSTPEVKKKGSLQRVRDFFSRRKKSSSANKADSGNIPPLAESAASDTHSDTASVTHEAAEAEDRAGSLARSESHASFTSDTPQPPVVSEETVHAALQEAVEPYDQLNREYQRSLQRSGTPLSGSASETAESSESRAPSLAGNTHNGFSAPDALASAARIVVNATENESTTAPIEPQWSGGNLNVPEFSSVREGSEHTATAEDRAGSLARSESHASFASDTSQPPVVSNASEDELTTAPIEPQWSGGILDVPGSSSVSEGSEHRATNDVNRSLVYTQAAAAIGKGNFILATGLLAQAAMPPVFTQTGSIASTSDLEYSDEDTTRSQQSALATVNAEQAAAASARQSASESVQDTESLSRTHSWASSHATPASTPPGLLRSVRGASYADSDTSGNVVSGPASGGFGAAFYGASAPYSLRPPPPLMLPVESGSLSVPASPHSDTAGRNAGGEALSPAASSIHANNIPDWWHSPLLQDSQVPLSGPVPPFSYAADRGEASNPFPYSAASGAASPAASSVLDTGASPNVPPSLRDSGYTTPFQDVHIRRDVPQTHRREGGFGPVSPPLPEVSGSAGGVPVESSSEMPVSTAPSSGSRPLGFSGSPFDTVHAAPEVVPDGKGSSTRNGAFGSDIGDRTQHNAPDLQAIKARYESAIGKMSLSDFIGKDETTGKYTGHIGAQLEYYKESAALSNEPARIKEAEQYTDRIGRTFLPYVRGEKGGDPEVQKRNLMDILYDVYKKNWNNLSEDASQLLPKNKSDAVKNVVDIALNGGLDAGGPIKYNDLGDRSTYYDLDAAKENHSLAVNTFNIYCKNSHETGRSAGGVRNDHQRRLQDSRQVSGQGQGLA